jgi:hypothetical protein
MSLLNILQTLGTLLTGVGASIVIVQLYQRKKQFTTQFEDHLTDEYREIVYEIPTDALLRQDDIDGYEGELKDYYRYFDLTNEQVFLRQEGRVSKSTWEEWREGIETHLDRPDFQNAWNELKNRAPDSFNELRNLENPEMENDPRYWEHPRKARFEEFRQWIWIF